ncbi:DUF3817 domain-containing protein [Rhizobium halophytocola]|uniref:Integral membrane protein n=1 Tax=Rhizobium halophytocola TaxID=735519 RepID=A0ABS4DSJ6_9HYPH|nr:DUF3817 domain-containing protein [Rhizobium halophytocola]MBP1848660.1 integral membrane protein [Rhizobium halophytocola]
MSAEFEPAVSSLPAAANPPADPLRWLRYGAMLEATTLLLLVAVAVPAKHLFGLPMATAIMGPVHGMAFLIYIWLVTSHASERAWSASTVIRLIAGAFIPLAGFVNERWLRRKMTSESTDSKGAL